MEETSGTSRKRKERSSLEGEGEETNPSNKKINERSMMSPTEVSPLNDDMLTEVLSYLPFDVVTRFKSVSKSWLRLISDPCFVSLRAQRSTAAVLGFLHQGVKGRAWRIHASLYRSIDNSRRRKLQRLLRGNYRILAVCNGFLFVVNYNNHSYFVWNLQMESLKGIPRPPYTSHMLMRYGLVAAVSCSDSYDIVGIDPFYAADNLAPSGFIYSSRTGVWTPFGCTSMNNMVMNIGWHLYSKLAGPACARGSLHWLTDDRRICAFDLGKQTLKWMSLPKKADIKSLGSGYYNIWLGSVGNRLYLLLVFGRDIELWLLENYEECQWGKVLEVKGSYSKGRAPAFFDGRRIALVTPEEWKLSNSEAKKWLYLYDTHSKKWEMPYILASYEGAGRYFVPLVEDKF